MVCDKRKKEVSKQDGNRESRLIYDGNTSDNTHERRERTARRRVMCSRLQTADSSKQEDRSSDDSDSRQPDRRQKKENRVYQRPARAQHGAAAESTADPGSLLCLKS